MKWPGRLLSKLNSRYPGGLYNDLAIRRLHNLEQLTLYRCERRLIRWLMELPDSEEEKTPPIAAELWQGMWLLVGIAFLAGGVPSGVLSWFCAGLLLYRAAEIFIFSLDWALAAGPFLHSYRRSLAGFMINLVETVVVFATLFRVFGCLPHPNDGRTAIYEALRTAVTIGPSRLSSKPNCVGLLIVEISLAVLLTVIIFANLASRIPREEPRR